MSDSYYQYFPKFIQKKDEILKVIIIGLEFEIKVE